MRDLIDRQEAIDALHMHLMYRMGTDSNKKRLDDWINGVPSAQPEPPEECERCMMEHTDEMEKLEAELAMAQPKRGRWISADAIFGGVPFYCSECGENTRDTVMGKPRWNFCPNCGADMRGEQMETDVVTVFEVLKAAYDKLEEWRKGVNRMNEKVSSSCNHENDYISRQAAIREYQEVCKGIKCSECPFLIKVNTEKGSHLITDCKLEAFLHDLPSAQSERNRGFWWAIEKGEKGYSAGNFRCSVCGEPNVSYISKPNFCPNCGADMRGTPDDQS